MLSRVIAKNVGDVFLRHTVESQLEAAEDEYQLGFKITIPLQCSYIVMKTVNYYDCR